MTWTDVLKIILTAVGGISGVAVIIGAVIKFSANRISERLLAKYELKLSKELESFKSGLENKNYVSKVRFDAEFEIYRQLSKSFFDMVKSIEGMIPSGFHKEPADKDARREKDKRVYIQASKDVVLAQDALHQNAPFMPLSFFELYNEVLGLAKMQLNVFSERWNVGFIATQEEKERLESDDYKRSREMSDKLTELNNKVREYLSKLDVANKEES